MHTVRNAKRWFTFAGAVLVVECCSLLASTKQERTDGKEGRSIRR